MPPSPLSRLRKLCLALPESYEKEAWGTSTFRVTKGKIFAMYADAATHAGAGRAAVWINAAPGNQELMLRADPKRFFFPPYVGKGGWIGVYLDAATDWKGLAGLLDDGWRLSAPKKLLAAPASRSPTPRARRR
ncbi:MAG TPA: MmcQ/YjbR family DNA-binding protein [Gemmatimonadales bacterium]|nr:MmcQ/YjbR family DNA-binding protein [Gemmatimonadales bacterium]